MSGTDLRGATTLVTGGAGTIGSTIVDQLLEAGVVSAGGLRAATGSSARTTTVSSATALSPS